MTTRTLKALKALRAAVPLLMVLAGEFTLMILLTLAGRM